MADPAQNRATLIDAPGVTELGESAVLPRAVQYPFLEADPEPGFLGRLAHFRIRRLLGAGGMGYVFEADDTQLARRVALKVMKPELATEHASRERFLREARAAAAVTSDHIVTVYQVGVSGDVPYQSMQLMEGETLQARLQRTAPLPVGLSCRIIRQVADGLAAAHAKGLTHRDIKPANIWLEPLQAARPTTRARILDFGLARAGSRESHLTSTGMIVGTPSYMSPEQASGNEIDGRADLFSLGCVAYTMLSGQLAFDGPSTMAILMALATRTPPPLCGINPAVPAALSDLVASMLAKDPDARPANALEVRDQIDAILRTLPDDSQEACESPCGPPSNVGDDSAPHTSVIAGGSTEVRGPSAPLPVAPPVGGARRRNRLWLGAGGLLTLLGAVGLVVLVVLGESNRGREPDTPAGVGAVGVREPLPVGILHSLSGTMALSEVPVVNATKLAIDEVNATGGVHGRQLVPVIIDGRSQPAEFEAAADRLLTEHKVAVIFGCWTSASRKAVRPVVERHDRLLFYPVQYEGLEQSPRVVYLGPAANQQLTPAVEFLVRREGRRRVFLVGSDYVFPRAAHEIVRDQAKAGSGAEVVGEAFIPLGGKDVAGAVAAIKSARPEAILNTVNGSTNYHLFRALKADPLLAAIPVLSVSLMETDLRSLDPASVAGDFLAGNYYEGVGSPNGDAFLAKFRSRYGLEQRYSDPLAAAYCGVHLWARAANACGRLDPQAVTSALRGMTFDGPAGVIRIDPDTMHAWLPVRIGRIRADGTVQLVQESARPVRPEPFPATRRREDWDRFLNDLFVTWDGRWQAPEPK
ncbi:MAG TPA: transporter substrate-binding protein [Gemmata sp.]|nr:transporter substrate-binding protein [Gemmata sp.]